MKLVDFIIIIFIIIFIGYGIYKMWLQLSGRKTCCGGSKEIVKPKKLKQVIAKKIVHINGMHCDNCKNSITKALNNLDGISGQVNLSKNIAIVSLEYEVSDDIIIKAIENKGFEVTKIEIE